MGSHFQRASLASRSRVWSLASVAGHACLFVPTMIVFGGVTIGGYAIAPLVAPQAETALEGTAWALGRGWEAGVALSHIFEGPITHDKIVADAAVDPPPPRPQAPIIIVPHPDISAPPLMPRHGGKPTDSKPKRKHRHASHQPDVFTPPPGRLPDTLMPAPVPHRDPDGAP